MLPVPAALAAYLGQPGTSVVVVDLLTLALGNGQTLRYTNGGQALTLAASMFAANSPLNGTGGPFTFLAGAPFDRVKIPPRKIGLDAQETDIQLYPRAADLIGNYTWQQMAVARQFDGATVEVDRFHWTGDGAQTPLGSFITVYGYVTDVAFGRTTVTLKAKTLPYLLETPFPRDLYTSACRYNFGDARCGYDRVNGKNALGATTGLGAQTVSAMAGSSQGQLVTSFSPSPPTSYNQGTAKGTSGANSGISCTIGQVISGLVKVTPGFPFAVSVGDAFQLLPGCDRTMPTCLNTFNNAATTGGRYGGFLYIPPPEQSL